MELTRPPLQTRDGIPIYIPATDAFYEGKFTATIPGPQGFSGKMKNMVLRRLRFLHEELRQLRARKGAPLTILDMACGGGHGLLPHYGVVTGVDISLQSLSQARKLYDTVICASCDELPFNDGAFDVVVAMDFLGHIPPEGKSALLAEIRRVLAPGGAALLYVETKGDNGMQRLASRHPDLYARYFEEPEGHVGLESPHRVLERLHAAGLLPARSIGAYKSWLKQPQEMQIRFAGEYARLYPWLKVPVMLDRAICSAAPLRQAATMLVELATPVLDRLLPFPMSDGLFIRAVRMKIGRASCRERVYVLV